jgi:hypothetical protein
MKTPTPIFFDTPFVLSEKENIITYSKGKISHIHTLQELENLQKETLKKIFFLLPFAQAKKEK